MKKKPAGPDPAELIRRAAHFIVYRFNGRGIAATRVAAENIDEARRLVGEIGPAPYGQRPLIYAIVPGLGSFPVD